MKTRIPRISTNLETCPPHLFAPIFLPSFPVRGNSWNSCLLSAFLCVPLFLCGCLLPSAFAATNDLSSALQKGLFEEEANHNYPAAIEAYQGVVNRFDEDRKLAATAMFRLGEIYRRQGKTNEANAQYERVVREFSDESALATLSQSYLAGSTALTINAPTTNANSESAPTSDEAEQVKRIRAMIRDSPDLINAPNSGASGMTPLDQAAFDGHLVVARFLVENGADVNLQTSDGETALLYAAYRGHKAIIELLLSHGAKIELLDRYGNTALHAAAQNGYRSIVELLLAHGANVHAKSGSGTTPLHLAVASGFKSIVEFLLSHGAEVNLVSSDAANQGRAHIFKGTPLHIAAERDDEPIAQLLLAHNANLNATNTTGDMPLGLCAKAGHTATAALLLSHGAEVNARNQVDGESKGWTPLLYAAVLGHKAIVALLLKNNADPNAKTENSNAWLVKGGTALLGAASRGDADIVELLLDSKADPNLQSDGGLTPARVAMNLSDVSRRKRILSLLLDHGADIESRDGRGQTLLMLAIEKRDKAIVELLLAHKANVSAKSSDGSTTLHYAAFSLQLNDSQNIAGKRFNGAYDDIPSIVEMLLAAGAEVNTQNATGVTPLSYIDSPQQRGLATGPVSQKVAQLLREHGAILDLPRLDVIEVRRLEASFSKVIFSKGTNGWDQFTLFDLIGVQYSLLSASPAGDLRKAERQFGGTFSPSSGLEFPDFKHIRVRHPKPDLKSWDERTIDIGTLLATGDCSSAAPLQLGDQVEIPEADHEIGLGWHGLDKPTLEALKKCLTRQVFVIVKDKTNNVSLGPDFSYTTNDLPTGLVAIHMKKFAPLMIKPALMESKLLLTSSDLSRIKLTRADPTTAQKRDLIVDCSDNAPAPSVWLRDGDVIEVPDKP